MKLKKVKISKDHYFHCEGCDFKSKKCSHINYFKEKFLCYHCKLKASKSNGFLPKLNVSDNTLKHNIKLKDIGITLYESQHMPKESRKGYLKVTNELKDWANKQEIKRQIDLPESSNKIMWVGLSKQERQRLFTHLKNQGMDELNILKEIEKIKQQITFAHNQYKNGLKSEKSFKEEFNKMVNR